MHVVGTGVGRLAVAGAGHLVEGSLHATNADSLHATNAGSLHATNAGVAARSKLARLDIFLYAIHFSGCLFF